MADQGKWFKLHVDWDDDPHIDGLSLENQVRWVKFGTYTKKHGTDGKLILVEPARALQHKFRLGSFDEVLEVLHLFPNYAVGEKQQNGGVRETTVTVSILNWLKYQSDFSTDRVRKFRARETDKKRGEEKRRDVEEKRRDIYTGASAPKAPAISASRFQKPTAPEVTAYAQSIGFKLDGHYFCDYQEARGWKLKTGPIKDWKAVIRTWKTNDFGGGKTDGTNVGTGLFSGTNTQNGTVGHSRPHSGLRTAAPIIGAVLDRIRDSRVSDSDRQEKPSEPDSDHQPERD